MSALQVDAASYLRLGLALVPIPAGVKGPRGNGWQKSPVTSPDHLDKLKQGGNLGLLHSASGTAVLDVDHLEYAALALERVGISLEALLTAPGPKIQTPKSQKPLYLLPEGLELTHHALAFKDANGKPISVFELRAGNVQDVLPPSLHPSGVAYRWVDGPPTTREDIPVLPGGLRALWEHWGELKAMLKAASPWYTPPPSKRYTTRSKSERSESVIAAFNERVHLRDLLTKHGYLPKGTRFIAPSSSTDIPGVAIFTSDAGPERVYSHHASDPLAGKHSHDAFSVFCTLEHSGDASAAVKEAARELGINQDPHRREVRVDMEPTEDSVEKDDSNFPLEVFPEAVRCQVSEGASALPVPPDNLAVAVLALAGATIGTSREIEIKPGWREGPRIYAAIVAEPGSKKSPALNLAAKPFYERQREAHLEYQAARKAYETEFRQYEQDRLKWRSAGGKEEMPTPPDEPTMVQVFTTDATLEATAGSWSAILEVSLPFKTS